MGVERRKKIRNEIRRGRRRDDVRDVDIRPKSRFNVRDSRQVPLKGITYRYPDIKDERYHGWVEGCRDRFDKKYPPRVKEERSEGKFKTEVKLKSEEEDIDKQHKIKIKE